MYRDENKALQNVSHLAFLVVASFLGEAYREGACHAPSSEGASQEEAFSLGGAGLERRGINMNLQQQSVHVHYLHMY